MRKVGLYAQKGKIIEHATKVYKHARQPCRRDADSIVREFSDTCFDIEDLWQALCALILHATSQNYSHTCRPPRYQVSLQDISKHERTYSITTRQQRLKRP